MPKYYVRTIRDLKKFGKKTILKLTVQQFKSEDCHAYFNEKFTFVDTFHMTKRYRKYLYESCQGRDIKYVSKQEKLSWDTVNNSYQSFVKKTTKLTEIKKIGIDEFSIKKGHKDFACVLVDSEKNCEIEVLKERKKAYLESFFKNIGSNFCEQIEVLSCDMLDGFANLPDSLLPNSQLVTDRFHVFKNLNNQLDNFRKNFRKVEITARKI